MLVAHQLQIRTRVRTWSFGPANSSSDVGPLAGSSAIVLGFLLQRTNSSSGDTNRSSAGTNSSSGHPNWSSGDPNRSSHKVCIRSVINRSSLKEVDSLKWGVAPSTISISDLRPSLELRGCWVSVAYGGATPPPPPSFFCSPYAEVTL